MTPTPTSDPRSKIVMPRQPRRISPEFAEVLHMLSSLEAKPAVMGQDPSKD